MKLACYTLLILFFSQFAYAQQQTIGLFINDSTAMNGYTLWSPNKSTYMIDNCGYLVKQWDHNVRPGLSVYLLENGHLLRTGAVGGTLNGAGSGGRIEEYNWAGDRLWWYDVSSPQYQQHHDIEPLPNGNILVIAWELRTAEEAVAAGAINERTYWSESVFELEKTGQDDAAIVWEWHMWDHLIQDNDSTKANYGVIADHPELLDINYRPPPPGGFGGGGDWLHFNAIDYDPVRDEIILSSRTHNEFYIIDHSTTTEEAAGHLGGRHGKGGDIIYRWGNPEAYDRGTNLDKMLYGQHNVEIVPDEYPGGGNYTMFNNGSGRPAGVFSTIEEVSPPRDENGFYILNEGEAYGPDEVSWHYIAPMPESFYSNNMAGCSRLPNGNTLICESNQGTYFEVTPDGEIAWLYQNTLDNNGPLTQGTTTHAFGAMAFRVTKYPVDYPAFDGKDMTPGEPIENDPVDYECMIYTDTTTSILDLGIAHELNVSYNMNTSFLTVKNNTIDIVSIHLLDMSGRSVRHIESVRNDCMIDISDFASGMYIINAQNKKTGHFKSMKFIKVK